MQTHTVAKVSRITKKGQTTVPKVVRQALNVEYGGEVEFLVDGNQVRVVNPNDRDPALESFLSLIERDITQAHNVNLIPEPTLKALQAALREDVDLDETLEGEVSL